MDGSRIESAERDRRRSNGGRPDSADKSDKGSSKDLPNTETGKEISPGNTDLAGTDQDSRRDGTLQSNDSKDTKELRDLSTKFDLLFGESEEVETAVSVSSARTDLMVQVLDEYPDNVDIIMLVKWLEKKLEALPEGGERNKVALRAGRLVYTEAHFRNSKQTKEYLIDQGMNPQKVEVEFGAMGRLLRQFKADQREELRHDPKKMKRWVMWKERTIVTGINALTE